MESENCFFFCFNILNFILVLPSSTVLAKIANVVDQRMSRFWISVKKKNHFAEKKDLSIS